MKASSWALALGLTLAAGSAHAATASAAMALATPAGPGAAVGTITVSDTAKGVAFRLDLHGLPPGEHGFHIHEKPSCDPATADGKTTPAGGAGPHLDPDASKMHMGPAGEGHLGDLPRITVKADGTANAILAAPRIRSADEVRGHALMIHAGGDNYADQPAPLGGGGARLACGAVG
jgi:Cu-Zn family superoxide dismutase